MAKQDLSWLDELNDEQKKAVTHGDGPLLVVAGAGSGKTRTLAYRVAYLIANGVDPGKILLLTFTRRAAEEMLKRASGIISRGTQITGRVWGGTFHATGNRILRMYAKAAGIKNDFTVLDRSDSEDAINLIRHDMGLQSREKRFPRKSACMSIYSRCVNGSEDLPAVLAKHFPWCDGWEEQLKELFKEYVVRKQERNVLDYDDLLLFWAELVSNKQMAEQMAKKFDHILVDEYQDTNKVQARLLKGMRHGNDNIMVVGDDAQSIYSFRAAAVRNMFEFPEQYPGTTILTLEQNYRSTMPILNTTNLVIEQAKERYTKNLWSAKTEGEPPKLVMCKDEAHQTEYIIERVMEHYEQGIPLHKQAVLFRIGYLSDFMEVELGRRSIPYHKYGGLRFLEAAHVKDLIAFLRIIENPRDDMAWFRAMQLLNGVGPATAKRAIEHVAANKYDPRSISKFDAPTAAREMVAKLGSMVKDIVSNSKMKPAAQIERIRKFYDPLIKQLYDNHAVRMHDIENLEQIAAGYKSRGKFLTDLQLDPPSSTSDLAGPSMIDEDWLVLSTIHSAKGCEWDVVYLIHAADGCLPSDLATGKEEEVAEELRLAYVAMTRARDFLYVSWPLRYYHKWYKYTDSHSYAQLSRFFSEAVCESMDRVELAPPDDEDEDSDITWDQDRDILGNMRAMWE